MQSTVYVVVPVGATTILPETAPCAENSALEHWSAFPEDQVKVTGWPGATKDALEDTETVGTPCAKATVIDSTTTSVSLEHIKSYWVTSLGATCTEPDSFPSVGKFTPLQTVAFVEDQLKVALPPGFICAGSALTEAVTSLVPVSLPGESPQRMLTKRTASTRPMTKNDMPATTHAFMFFYSIKRKGSVNVHNRKRA